MSVSRSQTPRLTSSASTNSFNAMKSPKTRVERQERQTNFKVVIRVRPPLPRELSGDIPFQNIIAIDDREQCITVSENLEAVLDEDGQVVANPGPYSTHSFMFDHVYDQNSTQKKVYETTARSVVDSALQGYNATIFAYGQTGTGKTFTMEGFNREGSIEARGIIPRAIEQIFGHIQRHASPRMRFLVRASYLQIYNEQISDLLKPERNNLAIREDKKKGVYVDMLSEWVVRSPAEIYGLMERGGAVRATGETKMNEVSSRSHAVFIVIAEQSETVYVDDKGAEMSPEAFQKFMHGRGVRREQEMSKLEDHVRQSFKVGKLNLVDLAGSERVRLSGATGQRLEECKQINSSLSHLGFVISALTDPKNRQHIPYRNSKLTRMLEDSLGGNCKTTMMAMVSPAFESMLETISTLKFANRAKNIRNEARVNEDLDQKSLLRKYERELKQLRAELEERSKNVVDKRRLLELDDQRRRAEADKMAAIRALEARSLEFMHEKEEKKKLEARIAALMGQMIRGERSGGDFEGGGGALGADGEVMMKEQQDKLRAEYESKLAGLERERETIEEEKAQVDRYKQLLLKQRDIMIALTQRLVERDEQIMSLQDELDAYDRHHKELEEKLDEKTAQMIKFQRMAMEGVAQHSPHKNEELAKAMSDSFSAETARSSRPGVATELVNNNNSSSGEEEDGRQGGVGSTRGDARQQVAALEESVRGQSVTIGTQRAKIGQLEALVSELRSQQQQQSSGGGAERDLQSLRSEVANLKTQNQQLQRVATGGGGSAGDTVALMARCDTLTKDREAVQTILEHKIKVLVQSVAQAASAVISSSPQSANGIAQTLTKDVASLQHLVNASIAALRNAAKATPPAPNTSAQNSPSVGSGVPTAPLPARPVTPSYGTAPGSLNNYTGSNYSGSTYGLPSPVPPAQQQQQQSSGYAYSGTATPNLGGGGSYRSAPPLPSPARTAPSVPLPPSASVSSSQSGGYMGSAGIGGGYSNNPSSSRPLSASSYLSGGTQQPSYLSSGSSAGSIGGGGGYLSSAAAGAGGASGVADSGYIRR